MDKHEALKKFRDLKGILSKSAYDEYMKEKEKDLLHEEMQDRTKYCPKCHAKLEMTEETPRYKFMACPQCEYEIKVYNSFKDFVEY